MKNVARGLGAALLSSTILVMPASAEGPAVAAANASIDIRGGDFDEGFVGLGFKGTVPLGQQFGAQLDVGVGTNEYFGAAGHLFWRDPSMALVGLVGSVETLDGSDLQRFGVEGELYYNKFTLFGQFGWQDDNGDDGAYGKAGASFYAQDSLKVTLGGDVADGDAHLIAGLEWKPEEFLLPGSTLFIEGKVGDESAIYVGWRMDLGATQNVSLIQRDRYYDPGEATWNPATGGKKTTTTRTESCISTCLTSEE